LWGRERERKIGKFSLPALKNAARGRKINTMEALKVETMADYMA